MGNPFFVTALHWPGTRMLHYARMTDDQAKKNAAKFCFMTWLVDGSGM